MDTSEGQKPGQREQGAELIGSYRVIATIARSELTTVYLAQKHGTLGFSRLAAIKRLNASFPDQAGGVQLLLDEARLSAGVRHANVVDVIDVGTEGGCHLVMDYIEGADFEALLARAGKERHPRFVLPPIVDALHGLDAAHGALDELGQPLSMVHQAPRARHILIGIDGTARITDFSQVSARGLLPSSLRANRLRTEFMAPEQLLGSSATARSDLFIVGVTLWEALTGERLFQADTPESSRRAVLQRQVPKPSEVGLKAPRCFDAICLRALARNPDQRYESALEMARELRDAALEEALYATSAELGQWVRALAGRTLIERRRKMGADAPSLELGIDVFGDAAEAFGTETTREVNAAPLRSSKTSAAPARVSVEARASTRERSAVEARASTRERSAVEARASTRSDGKARTRDDVGAGAIPSEASRVTPSTTVPGLGAPDLELPPHPRSVAPAPTGFPAPSATLLGLGRHIGRAPPPRDFAPTRPGARRDPAHSGPGSYSRVAAERRSSSTSTSIHSQPTVPVPRVSWRLADPPGDLDSGPSGAFRTGMRRDASGGAGDSGEPVEARGPAGEAEYEARSPVRGGDGERRVLAREHDFDEGPDYEDDVDSLQPPDWVARTRPPPEATPSTLGLRILTAVLVTIIVMAALVGIRKSREPDREVTRSTASRPVERASEPSQQELPRSGAAADRGAASLPSGPGTGSGHAVEPGHAARGAEPVGTRAPAAQQAVEARGPATATPRADAPAAMPAVGPAGAIAPPTRTPVAPRATASSASPRAASEEPAARMFAPTRAATAVPSGATTPRPPVAARPTQPAATTRPTQPAATTRPTQPAATTRPGAAARPAASALKRPPAPAASAPPAPLSQPPTQTLPRAPTAPAWQMHTPGLPENPY